MMLSERKDRAKCAIAMTIYQNDEYHSGYIEQIFKGETS